MSGAVPLAAALLSAPRTAMACICAKHDTPPVPALEDVTSIAWDNGVEIECGHTCTTSCGDFASVAVRGAGDLTPDVRCPCAYGCGRRFHVGCNKARTSVYRGDPGVCAICDARVP